MIKIKGIESYPGGKGASGSFQQIINEIRPHNQLIIPFLGNCAVARNISRANITIGIDTSAQIIKCWEEMNLEFIEVMVADGIQFLNTNLFYNREHFFFEEMETRTVIYCDPPYPIESRSSKRKMYDRELSMDEHLMLLKILKKQKCDVLISTYENDLYKSELKDWRLKKYQSMSRNGLREEWLFMNYDVPRELHDYSYLGHNYRERERISRKVKRNVSKILNLPILERKAIIKELVAADTGKSEMVELAKSIMMIPPGKNKYHGTIPTYK
jgi:site-specific DNA-adenine methylase